MMDEVPGSLGTTASLALRLGQTIFSSASLFFMCLDVDFYAYTAFCFLVTIMGLVIPWSVTLGLVDAYSVFIKFPMLQPRIMTVIISGDLVLSFLSLGAASATASVSQILIAAKFPMCPGKCIGQRNYRFFIMFISTSTFLCMYVFTFSLVNLLRRSKGVLHSLSDDLVSVILVVYCFVVVWFVGGLTVFHFYLMSTNQTTYENFRYRYERDMNPHNLGLFNNLKQVFFTRTPPSLVNFREMVVIEDMVAPETPSYHRYGESRKGDDVEKGKKLAKNSSMVLPGNSAQKSGYDGTDDKQRMTKTASDSDQSDASPDQGYRTRVQDVVTSKKAENVDAC